MRTGTMMLVVCFALCACGPGVVAPGDDDTTIPDGDDDTGDDDSDQREGRGRSVASFRV